MPHSEIVFSGGDVGSASLTRRVASGRLRRLGRGVYTTDLTTPPQQVVLRNWMEIVGQMMPHAVIVDRSVPTLRPDADGRLYVDHPRDRRLELPGLIVIPRRGPGPLANDIPLSGDRLWASSPGRGLIDNLRPTRTTAGRPAPTLSQQELHEWVGDLAGRGDPERLNRIRDEAKALVPLIGRLGDAERVDSLLGAALGTKTIATTSAALAARQSGQPFDRRRALLFHDLAEALRSTQPTVIALNPADDARRAWLPFFEAYFSNFIEGTEFTVDEAVDIIYRHGDAADRPADAHDIRGTFELVSDAAEMRRRPDSPAAFLSLLAERHSKIMAGRPDKHPGEWKRRRNRVGSVDFVSPADVEGTLARSWSALAAIDSPFHRAVYTMFVVSEVHPFDDGNGRVARVMANAELVGGGEARIIIPTVLRDNYLSSLRAMSSHGSASQLIAALDYARRWTAQVDWSTQRSAEAGLAATNATRDPKEADDAGVRLLLPSALLPSALLPSALFPSALGRHPPAARPAPE